MRGQSEEGAYLVCRQEECYTYTFKMGGSEGVGGNIFLVVNGLILMKI
jgi:hypothetical protein